MVKVSKELGAMLTTEPILAHWALGWEQAVVGLPTAIPGWTPIDAVTFTNTPVPPSNILNDYSRYWHPTGFTGTFDEQSMMPVSFRTFLFYDVLGEGISSARAGHGLRPGVPGLAQAMVLFVRLRERPGENPGHDAGREPAWSVQTGAAGALTTTMS